MTDLEARTVLTFKDQINLPTDWLSLTHNNASRNGATGKEELHFCSGRCAAAHFYGYLLTLERKLNEMVAV